MTGTAGTGVAPDAAIHGQPNEPARDMLAVDEVTTYVEGNMIWADATAIVEVTPVRAWESLAPLLTRIIAIPSEGEDSVKIRRVKDGVPLTHEGNRLVAKAARLGGIVNASMSMEVTESEPLRYLRLAVHTYNMHFADVDFRIDEADPGCRLSYRQGFRSRRDSSDRGGASDGQTPREMPETARIFNLWVELARAG